MNDTGSNIDPRIVATVRSLKEHSILPKKSLSQAKNQDLSSEKTSDNSDKREKKEKESKNGKKDKKNKKDKTEKEVEREKEETGVTMTNERKEKKRITNNSMKKNTKITIDGNRDIKKKSGTSVNHRSVSNKIQIFSKEKVNIGGEFLGNTFQAKSSTNNQINLMRYSYNYNNMKSRSKFVQNLLNDMSLKKYKLSCINMIKNDKEISKLYEQCGFEKTNYSYECFVQNNFFNNELFMYKLEMLFLDESNFTKKNFKEVFFKNEIINFLNKNSIEDEYQKQIHDLENIFNNTFDIISNFDLFHD